MHLSSQPSQEIRIGGRRISRADSPFIVAEMSGNHNQSLERALAIVDAAAKSGAHALKLQTYTAETMTLDIREREFLIEDQKSLWTGQSLFQLYQQAYTPWEWHAPIFERCREKGLIGFSSPFDESAVDFLETLKVPCYKIASFEVTDHLLLRRVAATGKPVILSTGMATVAEIFEAVAELRSAGCRQIIILKCTSTYPASPENTNILTIPHLRELFGTEIGLSDHTMGIGVAIGGTALGASLIEKHFTLSRADGGVDSAFSLEPNELSALVTESERAWQSLGKVHYGPTRAEENSLRFRRSLYFVKNIRAGESVTKQNVRAIRPGLGLPPKFFDSVIGRTAKIDIQPGTPVGWDLMS